MKERRKGIEDKKKEKGNMIKVEQCEEKKGKIMEMRIKRDKWRRRIR